MSTPPVALTIAGSDSGGGAGIQADLTTFATLGVHGASAVTAVTVQNTLGVHAVHPVPVDVVVHQVEAVAGDLPVAAVKTGMLGSADLVHALAALAERGLLPHLVVDPVMVSTTGQRLASDAAALALRDRLLPHADLVTPNTDEAAVLLGRERAGSLEGQRAQAAELLRLGPRAVVVTGGVDGPDRVDVLATGDVVVELRAPAIDTHNDHGTGCTFAAAVTASLARGEPLDLAVRRARAFVRRALAASAGWRLGAGAGPVAHTLAGTLHPALSTRPSDAVTPATAPVPP